MNKETMNRLMALIPNYKANKASMDSYKKVVDEENKEIKEIMLSEGVEEFTVGDIRATCTTATTYSFIEEALIAKLKKLKVKTPIKKKEYVDMDVLESAIYNGEISAADLADCQVKKDTVTLRLGKAK